MTIAEAILSKGEDSAEAVLYRDASLTYGELRARVAGVAAGLLARGGLKKDRVGIFSENSPFFVCAYLGIIRAGLTAVPFQTEISADTFSEIISNTRMREIFVSNRFFDRLRPWARDLRLSLLPEREWGARSIERGVASAKPDEWNGRDRTNGDDLAALMFTSGSTGAPKGVMVTHRNIECNTWDIISYMGLTSKDRAMVVLPFHYCFGLSLLHTHLTAGGSLVINNDFKLFPEAMLLEMQQNECTGFA